MKLSLSNWLNLGSAVIISVGVVLGVMFFTTIETQQEQAVWVRQKHQTITQFLTDRKVTGRYGNGPASLPNNQPAENSLFPYNQATTKIEGELKGASDLIAFEHSSIRTAVSVAAANYPNSPVLERSIGRSRLHLAEKKPSRLPNRKKN